MILEEFEDTKGVTRIHNSKDKQRNGQKKRTKGQTQNRVTRTLLRTGDELYDSLARTHLIPEVKTIINNTNPTKNRG